MKVEKIVRQDVLALRAEEAIDVAWRRMRDQRVEALHVTDSTGRLLGMLTEQDLLTRLAPRRSPRWWETISGSMDRLAADYMKATGLTVGDVMTMAPFVTITPDATVEEAAALMRQHELGALPAVANDICVGLVTRADVLDHLRWPAAALPGTVGDIGLERAMREAIEREAWASRHPVTVEARDGVIRLTGVVGSPVERAALLAMARSLAGATGVEDRLIILSRAGRSHTAPVI
jgi:CBS domain-containing protein